MKFSLAISALSLIGATNAVTLFLWKPSNRCGGAGIVCVDIPQNSCCRDGGLYGSGEARNPNGERGVTQLYTRQNNLDCGIPYGPIKPIPVCLLSGLDLSVSGMAWEARNVKRDGQVQGLSQCTNSVVGDHAYNDGTTVYIISRAKMTTARLAMPEKEDALLEFFKAHADKTMPYHEEVPTVQANATEK